MALIFYRQRDIDEMDVNNIPESFINYFETLDHEARFNLVGSRPDLAAALGIILDDNLDKEIQNVQDEEVDELFIQISKNTYEGQNVSKIVRDDMRPLEVLAVRDHSDNCYLHHTPFENKQIKYRVNGADYGIVLKICRKCNRIYLEESKMEPHHLALVKRKIPHVFYDLDLTNRYLRTLFPTHIMQKGEKIYVPDTWVEEQPECPVHDTELYEIPCEAAYNNRKISFSGFYCDQCNKILMRRSAALEIQDQCAINGIPMIETERLVKKAPKKKPLPPKDICPDYYIDNGKRISYKKKLNVDCFKLSEEDIVIVSDSIYCNLPDHDTQEVLALINVDEKRKGRKSYLFMVGYCSQCQKYYMDEEDYKAIYSIGRPEITIISDLDDNKYQITSGEVFNLERDHLNEVEEDIRGEIDSIHSQSDYVNPYATGDYDDGNLSYAKYVSNNKYGARLKQLDGYVPKPYSYRVDITQNGNNETYYVGAADVFVNGKQQVISANSDFGHELINYRTIKINKDGKEYSIKLSRQFDIQASRLFGYQNLRTDEDLVFNEKITDPFLIRVLNMRKQQHNLTDIFVTIQENQNRIVNAPFSSNIIVQGCAGSGKTMVLLHRLSQLEYREKGFDFSKYALILTPNDQFTLHIKGLAEELQIGGIPKESVEQYYMDLLRQYDNALVPTYGISSEMDVQQDYVDYIYSDQFIKDFNNAYSKVLSDRNALITMLSDLTAAMNQPARAIDTKDNVRCIQQMELAIDHLDSVVKHQDELIAIAEEELKRNTERKEFLEKKVPETREEINEIVKDSVQRTESLVDTYLSERQQIISQLEEDLEAIKSEHDQVQGTIFMFGKRGRLEKLDKDIADIERKLNEQNKKQEVDSRILRRDMTDLPPQEIMTWVSEVSILIPEIKSEIRMYKNARENHQRYAEELDGIDRIILESQSKVTKEYEKKYNNETRKSIRELAKKIGTYTTTGIYRQMFNQAVSWFKFENDIIQDNRRLHRFDLYARLLFAQKYYGKVVGDVKFMCIDEGQDLALNEYRLIQSQNNNTLIFNVFGDTNQLMKPGRGISEWGSLLRILSADQFQLNENYRNTNQITRFCNSSFGMEVKLTGVDGANVREISRKELEQELAELKSIDRVAILVPRSVQKSSYINQNLIPKTISRQIGNKIGNGFISLMYVDEVKGIEFDKAYVVKNRMSRNEKYIAYTRALSELILVVDEHIPDYDNAIFTEQKESPRQLKKETKEKRRTLSY